MWSKQAPEVTQTSKTSKNINLMKTTIFTVFLKVGTSEFSRFAIQKQLKNTHDIERLKKRLWTFFDGFVAFFIGHRQHVDRSRRGWFVCSLAWKAIPVQWRLLQAEAVPDLCHVGAFKIVWWYLRCVHLFASDPCVCIEIWSATFKCANHQLKLQTRPASRKHLKWLFVFVLKDLKNNKREIEPSIHQRCAAKKIRHTKYDYNSFEHKRKYYTDEKNKSNGGPAVNRQPGFHRGTRRAERHKTHGSTHHPTNKAANTKNNMKTNPQNT